MPTNLKCFRDIDGRSQMNGMALVGSWNLSPGRPSNRQPVVIQIVDYDLTHGLLACPEFDVAEGVSPCAELTDIKAFADDDDGSSRAS